jgi:hypothetical protein
MPYISKYHQSLLDPHIDKIHGLVAPDSDKIDYGALEYTIFRLVQLVANDKMKFANLNALVGTLETTKAEVLRRLLGPYEDLKLISSWKEKNGEENSE